MPSPFPSGNAANGLSIVYSKKLNAKFYANTSLMETCNTDWEGDIAGEGSKVVIRSRPDIAINDYEGTVNYQGIEPGKIDLPIDQAKYYAFKDDYIQSLQSSIAEVDESSLDASEKMKIHVEKDVHALMAAEAGLTVGDTTNGDVIDKTNVADFLVALRDQLSENDVPTMNRWVKLPVHLCGAIMLSEHFQADKSGSGKSPLLTGIKGTFADFTIYESNTLPRAGALTTVLAGTKHATAFASQFVNHESLTLESSFGVGHRGLKVYGRKVVKPDALVMSVVKKTV